MIENYLNANDPHPLSSDIPAAYSYFEAGQKYTLQKVKYLGFVKVRRKAQPDPVFHLNTEETASFLCLLHATNASGQVF